MPRFLRTLALFWLPVIAVLGVHEAALWRSGESWPAGRVLRHQVRRPEALFLRGYLDQSFYAYKWAGVLRARARVLALGSSRALKLRAEMFGADAPSFYNAGGLVLKLEDVFAFLEALPASHTPRVVILPVDMWWLNAARPDDEGFTGGIRDDGAFSWQSHLLALRTFLARPATARPALETLRPGAGVDLRIGLAARQRGEGFRLDGSFDNGLVSPTTEEGWAFRDRDSPPIARRIRRGLQLFEFAPEGASPRRLSRLRSALQAFTGRGILVVGFNPPLYSGGAALLEADPRHRRLWREYRDRVPRLFTELGLPFVDAATPQVLGLDDRSMIDGLHAEETFHLHVLRKALEDPRVEAALPTARRAVERALAAPGTDYWFADWGRRPPGARSGASVSR